MELKFGTAGIRGIMGPEPGLMNNETVRLATLGVAGWLKKTKPGKDLLAVISRDSRNNSLEFALETAKTLEECGIRALMFEEIMPVPVLSFAVRYLQADAGVMITASHNAKEYNGYKLYGATGGQVLPEDADVVQEAIGKIPDESVFGRPEAAFTPTYVPEEVSLAYLDAMRRASNAPQGGESAPLRVIYTPLNGSGCKPVLETLTADGYDLFTVPEQMEPDGNFTTTGQPNPEFPAVYRLALEYAEEIQPDIIVATDPDCDSVGSMVKTPDGYRLLSGNDQGVLVLSYLCDTRDLSGKTFISSFVSTPLADRIAEAKGMDVEKTPVGFKFIAAGMDRTQDMFGFAFEESNGMIIGQYARDKDGVVGARLLCQAAAYYKQQGSSAAEKLDELNAQYGPVYSKTIDVVVDPDLPKPETSVTEYDDGSKVVVRPSGTEPKVKHYFFAPSPERIEELKKLYGI